MSQRIHDLKHVLIFTYQLWGHSRPLISLSANLAKAGVEVITFVTTVGYIQRVKTELSRHFEPFDESSERVRCIAVGKTDPEELRSDALDDAFARTWKKLVAEDDIVCTATGKHFPSVLRPKAVILDVLAHKPVRDVRAISGDDVKILVFSPVQLCALYRFLGPEHLGGRGNLRLKCAEEASRTGRPFNEIRDEIWCDITGEVIHVPGMPPMHDYEFHPQASFPPHGVEAEWFCSAYETLTMGDAVVVMTTETYEPEAVAALRQWYGDLNKPAYIVGLPLARGSHASSGEKIQSKEADQIEMFLDHTLATSGDKSLLYIAFGTVYWPFNETDKVWAILDVVMEKSIPFMLSHASPLANVQDTVKEKVRGYGKGLLTSWAPQQMILNHPVTGWFVAQGGMNGVQEAIAAGVPQIFWPFAADQPLNAIHMSETLDLGYELLQVRSGLGLKPLCRNGKSAIGTMDALKEEVREVLDKAYGEDGARKRANLLELRKAILGEHEKGGHANRDLRALVESL